MNILKEEVAQTSIEVLLAIVGGIVVVTLVAVMIKSTANTASDTASQQTP